VEILHQLKWLLSSEGILHVINVWGLPGICAIIFAETAVFPILPGDSLLVVAGIAAGTVVAGGEPTLSLGSLLVLVPLCAILGDQVGYLIGRGVGHAVFRWPERRLGPLPLFKPEWVRMTEAFYQRWGVYTVLACRWVPIVRTLAPLLAGVGRMPWKRFLPFNVLGGASWVWSMVGLGWALVRGLQALISQFVPGFMVERHVDKIAIVVVLLSLLPMLLAFGKGHRRAPVPAAPRLRAKSRPSAGKRR
jgi:membrane-associated protein